MRRGREGVAWYCMAYALPVFFPISSISLARAPITNVTTTSAPRPRQFQIKPEPGARYRRLRHHTPKGHGTDLS